jgi:hypothetical protein
VYALPFARASLPRNRYRSAECGRIYQVDSVRTVVRQNNHAFVIEIDKEEMLKELEGEAVT